jgi:hypothetical protein
MLSGDGPRASHVGHGLRPCAGEVNQQTALAGHGYSATMDLGGGCSQLAERHDHLVDQFPDPGYVFQRRVHDK